MVNRSGKEIESKRVGEYFFRITVSPLSIIRGWSNPSSGRLFTSVHTALWLFTASLSMSAMLRRAKYATEITRAAGVAVDVAESAELANE